MSRWKRWSAGMAAIAGVLAPGAASPVVASAQRVDPLVVQTDKGAVRGVRDEGVDSFLGIRYAAAPVGDLRWRAPQPAEPWSGVQPATDFGNTCPATVSSNGPRSETEDCLFVNVNKHIAKARARVRLARLGAAADHGRDSPRPDVV